MRSRPSAVRTDTGSPGAKCRVEAGGLRCSLAQYLGLLCPPTTRADAQRREGTLMKFFVDTAEVDEIRELNALGLVDGVTTNPSLIKKSGRDFIETIREICDEVDGPVSAETVDLDYE